MRVLVLEQASVLVPLRVHLLKEIVIGQHMADERVMPVVMNWVGRPRRHRREVDLDVALSLRGRHDGFARMDRVGQQASRKPKHPERSKRRCYKGRRAPHGLNAPMSVQ
jgi:hypothetical protein